MNFHWLMVENNAKYFTVDNYKSHFWYITDVRDDGTYPCHPVDNKGNVYNPVKLDYQTKVKIHFAV